MITIMLTAIFLIILIGLIEGIHNLRKLYA
jgi:hypothetical protein